MTETIKHSTHSSTQRRQRTGLACLTKQQTVIARLSAQGMTARDIASRLTISQHTVESHKNTILSKLKINNTVELAHMVIKEIEQPEQMKIMREALAWSYQALGARWPNKYALENLTAAIEGREPSHRWPVVPPVGGESAKPVCATCNGLGKVMTATSLCCFYVECTECGGNDGTKY